MIFTPLTIDLLINGLATNCWIQGVVVCTHVSESAASFVVDDGTGGVECFLFGSDRSSMFRVGGISNVALNIFSSSSALRVLNEGKSPVGLCPVVGSCISVWGGSVAMVDPSDEGLAVKVRLFVFKWRTVDSIRETESNWLAIVSKASPLKVSD